MAAHLHTDDRDAVRRGDQALPPCTLTLDEAVTGRSSLLWLEVAHYGREGVREDALPMLGGVIDHAYRAVGLDGERIEGDSTRSAPGRVAEYVAAPVWEAEFQGLARVGWLTDDGLDTSVQKGQLQQTLVIDGAGGPRPSSGSYPVRQSHVQVRRAGLEGEEVRCHGSLQGRDSRRVEAPESVFEVATKGIGKPVIDLPPAVGIEPPELLEKTDSERWDT